MLYRCARILITPAFASAVLLGSCTSARKLAARRTRYMHQTFVSLQEGLNEADVTILSDSVRVLFPRSIMFDYKQATVREDFSPVLSRFANILGNYKKTGILVVGHTDSVGGDNTYNTVLSRRRADSARTVLQYYGVDTGRLQSWGLGAKDPVASNASETGRARNRRVEFIVLYNYKGSSRQP